MEKINFINEEQLTFVNIFLNTKVINWYNFYMKGVISLKFYSYISICIVAIGGGMLLFNYLNKDFNEPLVFAGFIAMLLGAIFSFVSVARNESGFLKFVAVGAFFTVILLACVLEPFQIIRMMVWLKN